MTVTKCPDPGVMKSSLAADNLFGDDNFHDELVNDVGGARMF